MPETRILKYHGYNMALVKYLATRVFYISINVNNIKRYWCE